MLNTFSILSLIIAIPFLGMLFTLFAKEAGDNGTRNVFSVAVFAVIANIVMILRIFMLMEVYKPGLQLVETYNWMQNPNIDIVFGVDVLSLMLLLAIHIAFIIGFIGVRNNLEHQKSLMVWSLMFLSMITGFFVAADIFSFYIFFEAMLLPLFMLLGMFGDVKRQEYINRFLLYNMLGAVIFFVATVLLFNYQHGMLELQQLNNMKLNSRLEYFIWAAIFISLLSRIPVWPFHYWIASVNSSIRNPMIFLISMILPLTGIYGFVRFLPKTLPSILGNYILILQIIGVVTMLFIALIGLINKDRQYKIFSYITVYYIMYMLGILTRNEVILLNIAFSFFSYLIIVASMEVFSHYIAKEQNQQGVLDDGLLCAYPKLSIIYSFMTLSAVGLPLSSLFLNNFLILSDLLAVNIKMGIIMLLSLVIVSSALLKELFRLRDAEKCALTASGQNDISRGIFSFMLFICFVLLMSFIKPLWFVIGA